MLYIYYKNCLPGVDKFDIICYTCLMRYEKIKIDRDYLESYLEEGMPISHIALQFGVSDYTIKLYMDEYGIKDMPMSEKLNNWVKDEEL